MLVAMGCEVILQVMERIYFVTFMIFLISWGTNCQIVTTAGQGIPQSNEAALRSIHPDITSEDIRKILSELLKEKQDCHWIVLTDPSSQSQIFE